MLSNIRIVLVQPSHPGNIGSAARAMKNMGLEHLFLVNPKQFPHQEAYYRSSKADDILDRAQVVQTLDEALIDCGLVLGTSARTREMPQPLLSVRDAANKVMTEFKNINTAVVFGPERTGLENADLQKCQYHIQIPTVEDFSSLNLAMAVQVIAYELFVANLENQSMESSVDEIKNLATAEQLDGLFQHIEKAMLHSEFLNPKNPRRLMPRIRQIIHRAHIDRDDLDLLRGMMSSILRLKTKD